ncbi:MAG: hypothetical protein ACREMA_16795 [Longimicrobiales bacterium]
MSAQHTPGPWAWDKTGHSLRPVTPAPDTSAVHTILSPDGCFGYMGSDFKATIAEDDANKRLIALAPDMFSILRTIMKLIDQGAPVSMILDENSPTLDAIRDMIAKAGEV